MPSARLVSEGVNDFVEVEGAIDNWFDARSIDGSYEIQLMLSAADNQTLKPSLLRHQLSGCDFAGPAGKNADQSNVAADCDGGYGLAEGAWASHLNDMIYATPSDQFPHPCTPIRMLSIIDRMIGAEAACSL